MSPSTLQRGFWKDIHMAGGTQKEPVRPQMPPDGIEKDVESLGVQISPKTAGSAHFRPF